MTSPRSAPPDLPGFSYEEGIGGGGFADVYLYRQHRPNRRVAVKVLRREHLTDESIAGFEAEADLMAQLSNHPYIVTIHGADLAPDGRPFIVMEHYPGAHFGVRAGQGGLAVAEVLRVGIQLAGAVETAHRAGILHRDIKPANILTSAYGRPGLSDFGISAVQHDGVVERAIGVSIGFSAPEVVDERSTGTPASDVYALGATLYTLVAGRGPFWARSGDNQDVNLIQRVLNEKPAPINRADFPPSLRNLIDQTLNKDARQRPQTAESLARSLQDIERELRLATTPLEVGESLTNPFTPGGTASAPPGRDSVAAPAVPPGSRPSPVVPPARPGLSPATAGDGLDDGDRTRAAIRVIGASKAPARPTATPVPSAPAPAFREPASDRAGPTPLTAPAAPTVSVPGPASPGPRSPRSSGPIAPTPRALAPTARSLPASTPTPAPASELLVEDTIYRPGRTDRPGVGAQAGPEADHPASPGPRRRRPAAVAVAATVVLAVAVGGAVAATRDPARSTTDPGPISTEVDPGPTMANIRPPTDVRVAAMPGGPSDTGFAITFTPTSPESEDTYVASVTGAIETAVPAKGSPIEIDYDQGGVPAGRVCVSVAAIRQGHVSIDSAPACFYPSDPSADAAP